MNFLEKIKTQTNNNIAVKNDIAKLLNANAEALRAFETAYRKQILDSGAISDNLFEINAKQAASERERPQIKAELEDLIDRIVSQLPTT